MFWCLFQQYAPAPDSVVRQGPVSVWNCGCFRLQYAGVTHCWRGGWLFMRSHYSGSLFILVLLKSNFDTLCNDISNYNCWFIFKVFLFFSNFVLNLSSNLFIIGYQNWVLLFIINNFVLYPRTTLLVSRLAYVEMITIKKTKISFSNFNVIKGESSKKWDHIFVFKNKTDWLVYVNMHLIFWKTIFNKCQIIQLSNKCFRPNASPVLKVSSKTFGTLEKVHLDYLRLSLPVTCKDQFVTRFVQFWSFSAYFDMPHKYFYAVFSWQQIIWRPYIFWKVI